MEFAERLAALATKVAQQKGSLETEEATKNAFVMPFISTILGYDVFDPGEVVPEFTADVGVKKGEKIDYAILLDDNNRKSIARLHFNRGQKYVGIFDENKKETRRPIDTIEQIYTLSDQLRATVDRLNS